MLPKDNNDIFNIDEEAHKEDIKEEDPKQQALSVTRTAKKVGGDVIKTVDTDECIPESEFMLEVNN